MFRKMFGVLVMTLLGSLQLAADPPAQELRKANALAKEVSPYLRQHAYNPVQWLPWNPDTLAKAKKEKKIIFLSIGYSACHWCHVMERESFSNADIAKVLNEHFICIKVDREERPDVDEVYLSALQASGQRGGWPLSMFLTHEAKPIFGGTYFPPNDRVVDGETISGFKSILKRVQELLEKDRQGLYDQADRLAELTTETLDRGFRLTPLIKMDRDLVTDATIDFEFDPEHGGFGRKANGFRGSKFPRASALLFLTQQSLRPGQEKLAKNVRLTLDKIAAGGIYDHLGGGFHRYSTERTWTVPHFEKMLYDNASLVEVYAEAYSQKANDHDARVIRETLEFIRREMTSPEGGFYSALDADTNHQEGEFYIWSSKEIEQLGDTPEAKLFKQVYSLDKPNFEGKSYILRLSESWPKLASQNNLGEAELRAKLEPLKKKLFDQRAKRERPFLDTKILTGWNGLMIGAYAKAGQVLKNSDYIKQAEKAAEYLLKSARKEDGRLVRMIAGLPGEKPTARGPAFLDDYAYMTHGLLNLYTATNNDKWLKAAREISDNMLKWYIDTDRGGFYTTANDGDQLFARGKEYYDGAYPSGNGQAARNLVRLWKFTQERNYAAQGERVIKQFLSIMKNSGSATPSLAMALDELLANPPK